MDLFLHSFPKPVETQTLKKKKVISSPGGAKHQLTLPALAIATDKLCCSFPFRTETPKLP